MKKLVVLFTCLALSFSGMSQNIPNGGFEDVVINENNPDLSYPANWHAYHAGWVWQECFPNPLLGELTNDSHTGAKAIVMETTSCVEFSGLVHRPAGFFTGNSGVWSPRTWSVDYTHRPEELNFYYKFHQENFDSAYVEVLLFNYDTTAGIPSSERVDTIAFSSARIFEQTDTYLPFSLPINYISDSIPGFINITFSSGEKNNCTLETCTPGTTLWVDDVTVSGGDVGIENIDALSKKLSLYPNPSCGSFQVQSKSPIQINRVSIHDYLGSELMVWSGFQQEFNIKALSSGTYIIHIQTSEGLAIKKLIKTNE